MQLYQTLRQQAKILEVINKTLDTECKTSSSIPGVGVEAGQIPKLVPIE